MSGLNKALLIGNLGRDPEMRYTPDGVPVTDFSLAVSDGKVDAVWFRVSCWRTLAELTNKYLLKGQQVYVEGRLRPREYEGPDGKRHSTLDVIADKVVFLGRKPGLGVPDSGVVLTDTVPIAEAAEDLGQLHPGAALDSNRVGLPIQPKAEAGGVSG
jgi:single-strand DNA-binding protein